MNPATNNSKLVPAASSQQKKAYQAPTVKVYGDVRDLTGTGPTHGVTDMTLSSPHFS